MNNEDIPVGMYQKISKKSVGIKKGEISLCLAHLLASPKIDIALYSDPLFVFFLLVYLKSFTKANFTASYYEQTRKRYTLRDYRSQP